MDARPLRSWSSASDRMPVGANRIAGVRRRRAHLNRGLLMPGRFRIDSTSAICAKNHQGLVTYRGGKLTSTAVRNEDASGALGRQVARHIVRRQAAGGI